MATTTLKSEGAASIVIKSGGIPLSDAVLVYSVEVEKRVNRISRARIVVIDGDAGTGQFAVSSSSLFVPGTSIHIEAGYDNSNALIFSGIVTGQSIRIDSQIGAALEVECRDAAVAMTIGRKSLTYHNKTDSNIISSIISRYAGLAINVAATSAVRPFQVQYYVTDWEYILSLAEANGMVVTTLNGTVSVMAPGADTTPVLIVKFGDQLMEFNADLDAINQLAGVSATSFDHTTQALVTAQATPDIAGPGNLSSKTLSKVLAQENYPLLISAPLQAADLAGLAKAQMIKSEYAKITGRAVFQGTALADTGKYITLGNIGDRFSGDHFISGVVHKFSVGNWITEVNIGLSPGWIDEKTSRQSPAFAGPLPGAAGLFNGIVKKVFDDPESQYRILVEVPLFDTGGEGIWARLANFYATGNAGAFFVPEAGDEVILGFLNEDPRCPVILGSVYSNTNNQPLQGLTPNENNQFKAIVSKSGIRLQFDDIDKILSITTPGNNVILLNDDSKQISINDQNGNSFVMSDSGIAMNSTRDITIEATQTINLIGHEGVKIQSPGGDTTITGVNIKETADVQYSAAGRATAQISGGGQLALKAGMILIN
jgi:Rhs element Vgr protein